MKLHRLFCVALVLALAVSAQGREPVDPLLRAASKALDHYQQIAPAVRCEDATTTDLRQDCMVSLEALGTRVQEAEATIASYRQRSTPQALDLFDTYQSFQRVTELAESLIVVSDFYGERNRKHFAEIYNGFVKVNGWFGGVVRQAIQDADKCSERRP